MLFRLTEALAWIHRIVFELSGVQRPVNLVANASVNQANTLVCDNLRR